MTEIAELQALHSVATHGCFEKAAEELDLDVDTLRSIVERLQARLAVRLLDEEAQGVSLTEAGVAFVDRTAHVLDALADVEASLRNTKAQPSGRLRISAPVVLGQLYVAPLIQKLRHRFRDLAVELSLMDRFVDLVHEQYDIAIRAGSPFDSRLDARRLCTNRRVMIASPKYLEVHGTPQSPEELSRHECILFTSSGISRQWRLSGPNGTVVVNVGGMVSTNNGYVLNTLAEQGEGITWSPTLSIAPALLDGRVVRVLPDYELEDNGIYAVYPAAERLPPKACAAVDFFSEHFTDPPLWDRTLAGKIPGF